MFTQSYFLDNPQLDFISGIILACDPTSVNYFTVKYSRQRDQAVEWLDLSYSQARYENYREFNFSRYLNAPHFRVDVHGQQPDSLKGRLIYFTPRSLSETTQYLSQKRIIFLGCVRNCAATILSTLQKIVDIGSLFKDFVIYLLENDSTDPSQEVLHHIPTQINLEIINYSGLDAIFPQRTQRLAFCRNTLLEKVHSSNLSPDYVCVVDMDGVVGELPTIPGFLSSFQYDPCWDAVFPVNEDSYYDVYALRHPLICNSDYYQRFKHFDASFGKLNALWFTLQTIGSLNFSTLAGWLEVNSAFGGMAIYKYPGLHRAHYVGIENDLEVCEHVAFHRDLIRENKRLFINPHFLIETHKVPVQIQISGGGESSAS